MQEVAAGRRRQRSHIARRYGSISNATAFTLVELIIVVAIIGVLASIAIPAIQKTIDRARVAKAIGDIRAIQSEVAALDTLPTSLTAVGRANYKDPWGRPYVYLKFTGVKSTGLARKDKFLVPLNSDFDLYSKGSDGVTALALTAKQSKDDVLRGNNGGFIGLATRY